mmetsp:Transcript_60667/g.130241  ORF Transcript_60667/g.130241 Transcript_60667/m.130241 type:complete len:233 (-) Transcript_60667:160-858(-)
MTTLPFTIMRTPRQEGLCLSEGADATIQAPCNCASCFCAWPTTPLGSSTPAPQRRRRTGTAPVPRSHVATLATKASSVPRGGGEALLTIAGSGATISQDDTSGLRLSSTALGDASVLWPISACFSMSTGEPIGLTLSTVAPGGDKASMTVPGSAALASCEFSRPSASWYGAKAVWVKGETFSLAFASANILEDGRVRCRTAWKRQRATINSTTISVPIVTPFMHCQQPASAS